MSDSDSSSTTTNTTTTSSAGSFEFINDPKNESNNQTKQTLISPSLSFVSTDCNIEDLNEEFRMQSELHENSNAPKPYETSQQTAGEERHNEMTTNISNTINLSSQTNQPNEEFDNAKLQEQLNSQIQSNRQHLDQQNNSVQTMTPVHQPQLTTQQLVEIDQKSPQPNMLQQLNTNLSSNTQPVAASLSDSQPIVAQVQTNQSIAKTSQSQSKQSEIAKISSPVNFDTSALFSWFGKQDFINQTISKVADHAVSGFNSVLITLDPQMKEIRLAGGPSILVTSKQTFDIESVRDGFLDVFKKATVKSIDTFLSVETAIQLVGHSTAHRISLERIKGLRSNISIVPQNQIIVSIENFLYNFEDSWFDSDFFLLDDPLNKIQLCVHTQGTPIEQKYVDKLKSKANHKFRLDGFSVRLDTLIATDLKCSIGDWHQEYVGFNKAKLHHQAVLLLSNLYKNKLKAIGRLNE